MKTKILIAFSFFGLIVPKTFSQTDSTDYLRLTPPGNTPVVFARGIVSVDTTLNHSSPAFSPDGNEVFWWINRPPRVPDGEWLSPLMMTMRRVDNVWISPEIAPYWGSPVYSADGKRLYFDYLKTDSGTFRSEGPWLVEKQGDSWSEIKCLDLVARYPELQSVQSLSITENGTLYFEAFAAGLVNNGGIYRSELINEEYAKPELLPSEINKPGILNWTAYIANDESYLIFSRQINNGDLYISFLDTLTYQWTNPVSMGSPINTVQQERFPSVSPDGKYLFFTRSVKENDADVFWVKADIIDTLKKNALPIVSVKNTFEKNVKLFPNPTKGIFTIFFGVTPVSKVRTEIFNTGGKLVFSGNFQNTTAANFDLTGYPAGIYLVKVVADGMENEEIILKEK